VTDPDAKLRFADGVVDAGRKRLIAVQEDHSGEGEAVNTVSTVGAPHRRDVTVHRNTALRVHERRCLFSRRHCAAVHWFWSPSRRSQMSPQEGARSFPSAVTTACWSHLASGA